MSTSERFLNARQVAERLGWSLAKVQRAARVGKIPGAHKMDGVTGAYVFDVDVVEAWLTEQKRTS